MAHFSLNPGLIKRMYDKSVVNLIIGKVETSIEFKVGVKQGDIMAPVLFLFLMMAFSKTLEDEWTDLGLSKAQFARMDNSPRPTGQFCEPPTRHLLVWNAI